MPHFRGAWRSFCQNLLLRPRLRNSDRIVPGHGSDGGGKKLPEFDALTMAYRAVSEGAAGVDMGRNIFQSEAPIPMIRAVAKVVHELLKPKQAYEFYQETKSEQERGSQGTRN